MKEINNLQERIESEGFGEIEFNNEPPEYNETYVESPVKKS